MEWIIIILLIITIFLSTYLFLISKELKRMAIFLKNKRETSSNQLMNQEISNKDLSRIIKEINVLLQKNRENKIIYEKKNEAMKKMMTNISHDLRTPLTSALGYINLINTGSLEQDEKQHYLKVIEERLKRLEELIHSFFFFSKVVSNHSAPTLEEVNLIAVLEESIAHFYEDFKENNRKIIFNTCSSKIKIFSNKEMLIRVFDNLIGNAFKHGVGNLEVTVENKEDLMITFTNAIVYSNLDIEHIFDEFYTIDISRTKENTGLGLAIAKEFIENLNGSICAKKEKNELKMAIVLSK